MSQDGALTFFHSDHTGTSVFYVLLKGTKIFYLVAPTPHNLALWNDHDQKPPNTFFGANPNLDPPCRKVVLTAGEAIVLGPRWLHCVETIGYSVVQASNFVHVKNLRVPSECYVDERKTGLPHSQSYRGFLVQIIVHILTSIRYLF